MSILAKITKFTSVAVIILGLLLFCRGVKLSLATSDFHLETAHHTTSEMSPEKDSSCCGTTGSGETTMDHTIAAVIPGNILNLIIGLALVMVGFLIRNLLYRVDLKKGGGYFQTIRDRYGSSQLFVIFLQLFRQGILNPKVY